MPTAAAPPAAGTDHPGSLDDTVDDNAGVAPTRPHSGPPAQTTSTTTPNNPTVLLADEPTANLDSGDGRDVGRLLRRLAEEDGRSIVIVSHDERLREVADRVVWLEDGVFRELAGMVTDSVCGMAVEPAGNPPRPSTGAPGGCARPTAATNSPPPRPSSPAGKASRPTEQARGNRDLPPGPPAARTATMNVNSRRGVGRELRNASRRYFLLVE